MRVIGNKIFNRATNLTFAFVIALSSLTAMGPLFLNNAASAVTSSTVRVTQGDLSDTGSSGWFMYNDSTDTIDNTLGSFVAGPSTPPSGVGSVQFTLGAHPNDRKNIATYQFGGTNLADITSMSYVAYSHSGVAGATESPFFNFNVDLANTNSWQKRLVYVPSANGAVPQDTWNTYDVINSGNAFWTWSGYNGNGNKWPDGNTDRYRTWTDINTTWSNAKILSADSWLGVRVGEPGPNGYTGNIDSFTLGTASSTTKYDFEPFTPPAAATQSSQVVRPADLSLGGWYYWNDSSDTPSTIGTASENNIVADPADSAKGALEFNSADKLNIATNLYAGTKLTDIAAVGYSSYNTSAQNASTYMQFNVSLDGSNTWQNRLTFIPANSNGSWQQNEGIQGGNGLWEWSKMTTGAASAWPDGSTTSKRTWSDIINAFPNAKIQDGALGQLLVRSEHDTHNYVDNIYLATSASNVRYDFEQPDKVAPVVSNIKMFVNGTESTFMRPGDTVRVVATVTDPPLGSGVNPSNVRLLARSIVTTNGGYIDSGYFVNTSGDTYERAFTFPADGKYTDTHKTITQDVNGLRFYIKAFDNAGNYTNSAATTFTNDQTIPSMQNIKFFVKNSAGVYVSSNYVKAGDQARVEVEATDMASGIKNVEFRIQDAATGAYVAPRTYESSPVTGNTYRYDFTVPTDGKYINTHGPITDIANGLKFWARAYDNVGNYGNGTNTNGLSGSFTYDNTEPTVPSFIMKDSNGNIVTNGYITTQYFTVNLTNPSAEGVVRYQLKYSNGFNSVVWNPSDLSTTGHMSTLGIYTDNFTQGEGVHNFAFSACDAANNCSAYSTPYSVTYDNTAPAAAITTTGTQATATPTINGNVDPDADSLVFTIDGIVQPLIWTSGDTTWTSTPASALAEGTHTMSIVAKDLAGNEGGQSGTITISLPPTVVTPLITPAESQTPTITPQATITPITTDTAVLGDTTTTPAVETADTNNGDADVAGATDDQSNAGDLFGLAWYWYLAMLAALGLLWWLIAAWRRRSEEQ